jgi:hypothetical protein
VRAGRRWAGYAGVAVGAVGILAAFRNATPSVGPIADINNNILPLWLVALGIVLVRARIRRPGVIDVANGSAGRDA